MSSKMPMPTYISTETTAHQRTIYVACPCGADFLERTSRATTCKPGAYDPVSRWR